jgi:hypothetical protein
MKILLGLILCLNILFCEDDNKNIVKTSELELFLFKVGFESLLKDVSFTKNKMEINEEELKKLSSKVELIMNEIYKEKKVTNTEGNSPFIINNSNNEELENLKKEISLLKIQMQELSKNKIIENKKDITQDINKEQKNKILVDEKEKENIKTIAVARSNIREEPNINAKIVEVLKKDTQIKIEFCDKYDWCKLKDEEKYISKLLLN